MQILDGQTKSIMAFLIMANCFHAHIRNSDNFHYFVKIQCRQANLISKAILLDGEYFGGLGRVLKVNGRYLLNSEKHLRV